MPRILVGFSIAIALLGCGKKKEEAGGGTDPKPVDQPATCPPGQAIKDGACVAAVTAERVEAVAQQKTRLDDLAKLLDQAEVVAGPIEILNGMAQQEVWKKAVAANPKLKIIEQIVATLDNGAKQLRALKGSLGEAATRLGNLQGELDQVLKQTGAAKKLEDLQGQVRTELQAAIEPLANQVATTIQEALLPLSEKLGDTADLVLGACAMAKVSGGGDEMKKLCAGAKDAFGQAEKFLDDFKTKPTLMFTQIKSELESKLGELIDQQTHQLLDAAQAKVNDALKLPPAGSGSGSGSGS